MHAPEKNGPSNAAGVLSLEEQGLRLSVYETEDLGVTTDVEFTLMFEQEYPFISKSLP